MKGTMEKKTKRCARCERELSIDAFGYNKSTKDGRYCYCKKCVNEMQRSWRREHPAEAKEKAKRAYMRRCLKEEHRKVLPTKTRIQVLTKVCRRCGEEKSVEEFHISNFNRDGRVSYCKTCSSEKHKEWVRKQKEILGEDYTWVRHVRYMEKKKTLSPKPHPASPKGRSRGY